MPLLNQREVMPNVFKVLGGKPGLLLPNPGDMFSGAFDGGLTVLNDSEGSFTVEQVTESPIKGSVPFVFGGFQQFEGLGDLVGVVHVPGPEATVTFEELFDHEPFGGTGGDSDGFRASRGVLPDTGLTSVIQTSPGALVGFEGIPAGSATQNTGQKPGGSSGSCRCDSAGGVGCLEGGSVNERLVAFEVDDALSSVDLAEIYTVRNQVSDGPHGPGAGGLTGDPVRDLAPCLPGGASIEGFFDEGSFGTGLESSGGVFDVAEGNVSADIYASVDGVGSGDEPAFALPVNFELSDGAHYRGDHASGFAAGVDAFGNGEKGSVVGGENVKEFSEVADGSAEPVEFRHDDPFGFTGSDAVYGLVESGSVAFFAGLVEILENFKEWFTMKACPSFNAFALLGGRDEAFAFPSGDPGHPHIAVYSHWSLAYRAFLSSCGKGLTHFPLFQAVFNPLTVGAAAPLRGAA